MSSQKSTCRANFGKSTLSANEVINLFQDRKNKNLSMLMSYPSLSFKDKGRGLKGDIPVTIIGKDEIVTGSFCSYCQEYIKGYDPWERGVYCFPICNTCFDYVGIIENFLSDKNTKTNNSIRRIMSDPSSVSIDWDYFEKLINNNQAKLSLLSTKYKLYPSEIKELLSNKYGDKIVFKKGRYGGIFWTKELTKENERS
ncbi:MAG: hypothetical protein H8E32_00215 [Nitrospinae bacterium]|nr:hypothetical protein [Nitrospinota bacterium]